MSYSRNQVSNSKRRLVTRLNRSKATQQQRNTVNNVKTVLDQTRNQDKLVILREPGRFCPERLFCKLVMTDPVMSRGNVGFDVANWYYQSSLFNPDPSNAGEQLPGHAELANLYENYRVHSIHVDVEMFNQNSEAAILSVWPSAVLSPTNTLNHQEILELGSNVACKTAMCGTSGSAGKVRIRTLASALKLFGPGFARDDDYSADQGANPLEMFYVNVGICDCVGAMTYNPVFRTRLTYEVEFFTPRTLMS